MIGTKRGTTSFKSANIKEQEESQIRGYLPAKQRKLDYKPHFVDLTVLWNGRKISKI